VIYVVAGKEYWHETDKSPSTIIGDLSYLFPAKQTAD